jgi:pimeloyl-ACP methyl ester carboxylesterase
MSTPISRHFATVGQRQVHYRRAGEGPMVFLLNQSPNSSTEYIPLIQRLAKNHTVIAPDTPGNGLSDPLTIDQPVMGDFADAVVGLFDELGVDKAPVYGFHTGGLCALEMARRNPDRVTMTISNGYLQMEQAEIDAILENYFAKLTIDWSGSHLTFVWARMRNQYVFFPWFRTEVAARMDYDMPPPEHIHEAVMEILRAGDHYRGPYRAAFTFSAAEAVQQAKAPAVVMTSKQDVLFPGMARMPTPAASVRTMEPETHAASEDLLEQLLLETPGPNAPAVAPTKPLKGRTHAEFIPVEGGDLYARRNTDVGGRPIVFQHASASSSWGCDRLMQHFIGRRPVLAVDLPGNGESGDLIGADEDVVARQAAFLAQAIRQLGYSEVDFFGDWGGGTVGVELAVQEPDLVKHLAVPNLVFLEADNRDEYAQRYTPEIVIDENGCHFIKVWNMVRDQTLYAPWFERKKANIIRSGEPDIAPEVIHRRTLDLLKCGDRYRALYAAHFSYPILQRLTDVQCPILLGSPGSPASQRAAGLGLKNYQLNELPSDDRAQLADAMMAFFDT